MRALREIQMNTEKHRTYEHITSPHNARLKDALRLYTSRGRKRQNRILVCGLREVSRAVDAGIRFEELFFSDDADPSETQIQRLLNLKEHSPRIGFLANPLFEKLAYGDRAATVVGIARRPEKTLSSIPLADDSVLIVLESLEKPGNLGAIARSADAAGVSAILLADPVADIYHPNAIRASVSTIFSIPTIADSQDAIEQWLLANGCQIYFATPEATQSLYDVRLNGRIAFVLGSEAHGLSPLWRQGPGTGIHLPMRGIGDSLNVSVTASLMMYETLRQRSFRS